MATTSRAPLRLVAAAVLAALAAMPLAAQPVQGGALPGPLPLFPADHWWNVDVTTAPVDAASAAYIAYINDPVAHPQGPPPMHPDWGGDTDTYPYTYGMPYIVVPGDQPLEQIASFTYPGESDWGAPGRPTGYPIPVEAKTQPHWIEGGAAGNVNVGGDKHMLIVDKDHRLLFELWNTRCTPYGSASCTWRAGSGAVFSLDSDGRRPEGWTSADAAGLAVLPGLVRYDEAYGAAPIRHALRMTVRATNGYVWPASHVAGTSSGALPMGARLRLKPGVNVSSGDAGVQKIVQAMKSYGLIVADNGSDMYVQGTYDTRWDNGVLNPALGQLHAQDFEVLQLGWKPALSQSNGPLRLYTLTPCRVLDTRDAPGAYGAPALWPRSQRTFLAASACGIPANARGLVANVTVVQPSAAGSLRIWSGDDPAPSGSAITYAPGRVRANNLVLGLSSTGVGTFIIQNDGDGTADVLIDVSGYLR